MMQKNEGKFHYLMQKMWRMLKYDADATNKDQANGGVSVDFGDVIAILGAYVCECDAFFTLMASPSF